MRSFLVTCSLLLLAGITFAGHTRPGYVDGCQSADERYVVGPHTGRCYGRRTGTTSLAPSVMAQGYKCECESTTECRMMGSQYPLLPQTHPLGSKS